MGGTASQPTDGAPVIAVIGCGFGGLAVAQLLESHFNVVVFDRKRYIFNNVAALRGSMGREDFPPGLCVIPLEKAFKRAQFFQADIERITPTGVHLKGRAEPVRFDYCIIATGTAYAFPFKVPNAEPVDVVNSMNQVAGVVRNARSITIVGGGPVGIELAGEIRDVHPDKRIVLVHSGTRLLDEKFKPELHGKLIAQLAERNIEVVLNDRVVLTEDERKSKGCFLAGQRVIRTERGRALETDLVFLCTGPRVNNKSFKFTFPIGNDGRINIDKNTFQVSGHRNIFALGDCAGGPDMQLAWAAGQQAKHVNKIIRALHAGKTNLPRYGPLPLATVVPIGSNGGAGQLPIMGGMIVGKKVTRAAKGKDLLAGKVWQSANQPVPKELTALGEHAAPQPLNDDSLRKVASNLKLTPSEVRAIEQLRLTIEDDTEDNHT